VKLPTESQSAPPSRRFRVLLVTQDEPFHIPFSLRSFFRRLDRKTVNIVAMVVLAPMNKNLWELASRMFFFLGPIGFVRRGVAYLVLQLLERLGLTWRWPKALAKRNGVEILNISSVNSTALIEFIERERIDVLASISCPQVLRPRTLQAPSWGCLNVHSGRLPKYRGLMPCFWAMYNGEQTVGVSVHTMVEAIDGGKIVRRADVAIRSTDSWDRVVRACKVVGGELMAEALGQIANGEETLEEQEGEGAYFSFPSRSDAREMRRRGRRIL